jgi:hypothetical protein
MPVIKEIDKVFVKYFIIVVLTAVALYWLFTVIDYKPLLPLTPTQVKIFEYFFSGIAVIQMFAIYITIQKVLFKHEVIDKILRGIPDSEFEKSKLPPKETMIVNTTNMIYSQGIIVIIFGAGIGLLGAEIFTILSFFIIAILMIFVSWLFIRHKSKTFFVE